MKKLITSVFFILSAFAMAMAENFFLTAVPVWPSGQAERMNDFVRFEAKFDWTGEDRPLLRITGSSVYRLKLNGEYLGYGPARAAKGFFRVDEWPLEKAKRGENRLSIEVSAYNCRNFYHMRQSAFLQAEVVMGEKVLAATPKDFHAYDTERRQVVSRYSFQRGFSEAYRLPHAAKELTLETREQVRLLPRIASYPQFQLFREYRPRSRIGMRWDGEAEHRRERFIDRVDNKKIDGFLMAQLEFNGYEAAYRWRATATGTAQGENFALKANEGVTFVAPVNRCGFFGVKVKVPARATLVARFDEFADGVEVNACRCSSANVVQWELGAGEYELETFEPYLAAGLQLFLSAGAAELGVPHLREYASPDATRPSPTDDPELKAIFEAARESFRANAVDVFTDCPSRERAGWLCDSFFLGRSAKFFTGSTKLERLFLENYLLPEKFDYLPEGVLPMCYPSDHADGVFIPNWNFWLVLELEEYLKRSGDRKLIDDFKPKMMALVKFISQYENADGLLENLPSWVFVEWSKANQLVKGVNYPSNATWAAALAAMARMYAMEELAAKAERMRETIRAQAWNGEWFVDQALRSSDGKLERGTIATEVAQYYQFYFQVATPQRYPELWRRLKEDFGPERLKQGKFPEVPPAAEFIGNYLRLELLSLAGLHEQVLKEMGGYFNKMAVKTGTLWETSSEGASKNHGFASYAATWIDAAVKAKQ